MDLRLPAPGATVKRLVGPLVAWVGSGDDVDRDRDGLRQVGVDEHGQSIYAPSTGISYRIPWPPDR
jgi:hypothetical protein